MTIQSQVSRSGRPVLAQVTLCAATSVNVKATIRALEVCLAQADFAACRLFTDANVQPEHPDIIVVPIPHLGSAAAYSDFLLTGMVDHVDTSHCLVVQWDGHVIDAQCWLPEFLEYDYIGASWPQFSDGHDVGNGGFSLRSRRLMEACRNPGFRASHPEDLAIGRDNRDWLEDRGLRFAPRALADRFAAERAGDPDTSFGYHGVWHMVHVMGVDTFWNIYRDLDERGTIRHDMMDILKQIWCGQDRISRILKMNLDVIKYYSSRII